MKLILKFQVFMNLDVLMFEVLADIIQHHWRLAVDGNRVSEGGLRKRMKEGECLRGKTVQVNGCSLFI